MLFPQEVHVTANTFPSYMHVQLTLLLPRKYMFNLYTRTRWSWKCILLLGPNIMEGHYHVSFPSAALQPVVAERHKKPLALQHGLEMVVSNPNLRCHWARPTFHPCYIPVQQTSPRTTTTDSQNQLSLYSNTMRLRAQYSQIHYIPITVSYQGVLHFLC